MKTLRPRPVQKALPRLPETQNGSRKLQKRCELATVPGSVSPLSLMPHPYKSAAMFADRQGLLTKCGTRSYVKARCNDGGVERVYQQEKRTCNIANSAARVRGFPPSDWAAGI